MTRTEILEAYHVESGFITSPGKFESEPVYAPVFHAASLDGSAETLDWSDGSVTYVVEVDENDRTEWPELGAGCVAVGVEESEQGFVSITPMTQDALDRLHAAYEADTVEEDEGEEDDDEG